MARKEDRLFYTMNLDRATRDDLKQIAAESRTANSTAAVIRGMSARYWSLLSRQIAAEARGAKVYVTVVNPDTKAVLEQTELDLRL